MVQDNNNSEVANENNRNAEQNASNDTGLSWGKMLLGVAGAAAVVAGGVALNNHIENKKQKKQIEKRLEELRKNQKKEPEPSFLGQLLTGAIGLANEAMSNAQAASEEAKNLSNRDLVNQSLNGSGWKRAAAEIEFQKRSGLR